MFCGLLASLFHASSLDIVQCTALLATDIYVILIYVQDDNYGKHEDATT